MSKRFSIFLTAFGAVTGAAQVPAPDYRATINQYCVTCHNNRAKTGGLALDTLDLARVPDNAEVYVMQALSGG